MDEARLSDDLLEGDNGGLFDGDNCLSGMEVSDPPLRNILRFAFFVIFSSSSIFFRCVGSDVNLSTRSSFSATFLVKLFSLERGGGGSQTPVFSLYLFSCSFLSL